MPDSPFVAPLSWEIRQGESWTVTGENGSGKSLLAEIITGRYALKSGCIEYHFLEELQKLQSSDEPVLPRNYIKIVHFNGVHSLAGFREAYYQQRFNQCESEDIPCVSELFSDDEALQIISLLNINKLLNRRINQLSSGELRKLLIAKTLLEKPRMLIFDNPFIGLDVKAREQLNDVFMQLRSAGMHLLFLAPSQKDIPSCSTHILEMCQTRVVWQGRACDYSPALPVEKVEIPEINWQRFPLSNATSSDEVVVMKNIKIAYGETVINDNINWIIKKGEKWALLGPNGSGKSTLLSYVFADNPQAYAKDLSLFGRRRGTGESIWDIKKRIGFTSSEMHLYYRQNVNCQAVVTSGFFDSIGLYRKVNEDQLHLAEYLFQLFNIEHLMERSFLKVSSGEQRLILFMRALIKNPELLILDEPFHGLDMKRKAFCTAVIESFCRQPGKTLIYVTHRREEIPTSVTRTIEL